MVTEWTINVTHLYNEEMIILTKVGKRRRKISGGESMPISLSLLPGVKKKSFKADK